MCSTPGEPPASTSGTGQPGALGSSGAVARLGRAIDELAEAAQAQGGGAQASGTQDSGARDFAALLAAVWEMVAELDPELTRRLAGYGD